MKSPLICLLYMIQLLEITNYNDTDSKRSVCLDVRNSLVIKEKKR